MTGFSKFEFSSLLLKGQLHEAVSYLSKFPEEKAFLEKYMHIFQNGQYLDRTDNETLRKLDYIYQDYYRNVFWNRLPSEEANKDLFNKLWVFCGSKNELPKDENIEYEVEKIVNSEGYEFLGGCTQGYYGPYIWASSEKVTYEVEIPSGIEPYTIIMMDGFISNSWLDFISFGKTGTGGWASDDGTLCCIKSLYNVESDNFKISFLKHEAQHAYDKKRYSVISSADLEYRAKLVELIYWPDTQKIIDFCRDADDSNPDNSHAIASYRICCDIVNKLFHGEKVNDESVWYDKLEDVKRCVLELLEESSKKLDLACGISQ